jgi:hypothetical protein
LIENRPIVTNLIDEKFSQLVVTPKGTLWILPAFEDNSKALLSAMSNLETIPKTIEGLYSNGPATPAAKPEIRDVFISHAWEDKEFARPLAEHLRSNGISVWFDEYELKLGDSLRQRIEDGLRQSKHGLVVLSQNFFKKRWPQQELNALFALESSERRILPLWHGLNVEQVRVLAPLLADKLAISTDKGIPAITDEIRRALSGK